MILRVRPRNSLLVVGDSERLETPELADTLVFATESCLCIRTLTSADGETQLEVDVSATQRPLSLRCYHAGTIATPRGALQVATVYLETYVRLAVTKPRTSIEVWANDDNEPDHIVLVVPGALILEPNTPMGSPQ